MEDRNGTSTLIVKPGVLRKPGGATRNLIRRIGQPTGQRKPITGISSRSGRVSLKPNRSGIMTSVPTLPLPPMTLPPMTHTGSGVSIPGGTTVYHWPHHSLPWYCLPTSSYYYGSYLGSRTIPVWHHPWAIGFSSPWYLGYSDPWCHSWALPWYSCSSANYVWWHHGRWSSRNQSSLWVSTIWSDLGDDGYDPESTTVIDDDGFDSQSVREVHRAQLCDGWHALAEGDPATALPLIDSALEGLSDSGLPWLLRSIGRLAVDDLDGAAEDLGIAIELDPSLLSIRWNEADFLGDHGVAIRSQLWARLEQDPADVSSAMLIGVLSLLSDDVADAPARGAVSELLLDGHGNSTTVAVHGALRGESPVEPSPAAAWLMNPDCSGLREVLP
ncbi:MAG: hypothetical protein OSB09_10935 [Planctomycetota bacterium]|nr:hypothetical protein [Planctomycetota bacterium]